MRPKPQETAGLVTFIEEILNGSGKPHLLYSASVSNEQEFSKEYFLFVKMDLSD